MAKSHGHGAFMQGVPDAEEEAGGHDDGLTEPVQVKRKKALKATAGKPHKEKAKVATDFPMCFPSRAAGFDLPQAVWRQSRCLFVADAGSHCPQGSSSSP